MNNMNMNKKILTLCHGVICPTPTHCSRHSLGFGSWVTVITSNVL